LADRCERRDDHGHQPDASTDIEQVSSPDVRNSITATPSALTIPYDNYIGAVLGARYRLKGLLRHENHGDVFAAEDICYRGDRYEVKAYVLHNLPEKLYHYRTRNLKKLTAKPSFVCSLDQNGFKYAVNQVTAESEGVPILTLKEKKRLIQIGDMGRRKTKEFDEAFPRWPHLRKLNRLLLHLEGVLIGEKVGPAREYHGSALLRSWVAWLLLLAQSMLPSLLTCLIHLFRVYGARQRSPLPIMK
jgi:hypothetical protein